MKAFAKKYFGYLDSIYSICYQSWGVKSILHEILQSLHEEINFTCDVFGDRVNFLNKNVNKKLNYSEHIFSTKNGCTALLTIRLSILKIMYPLILAGLI